MMERRTEESLAALRRAVSLNPNSAAAHSHLSRGFAFAGRDREAIEHADVAIRLSPLDPEMALFLGAIAAASVHEAPAVGGGLDLRLTSPSVTGAALADEGNVVHLSAFVSP